MHNFLRLSEATSLGLHGMALIVHRGERISVKEMAELLGVSEAHLAKVFQQLVKKGLVRSHRGPRGGFELARNPEAISFLEIYEALEGSLEPQRCLLNCQDCPFGECFLGEPLQKMQEEFVSFLRETTLDMLREKE